MNALRHYAAPRTLLAWSVAYVVLLTAFSVSNRAQQQSADTKTGAPLAQPPAGIVTLIVSVTDSDYNYVSGLTKDNFTITEDKTTREISFFSEQNEPISIGVLFDMSDSMTGIDRGEYDQVKLAVLHLIGHCHPASQVFVADFSNNFRLITDWTDKSQVILAAVKSAGKNDGQQQKLKIGQTALYDGCMSALDILAHATHRKQVLLLITDGEDNHSATTFSELRQRLRASGVLLYTILAIGRRGPSELDIAGQAIVDEMSAVTGGRAFFPRDRTEVEEVTERIAIELQHQYLIGFTPGNRKGDGKWTPIKIKATLPPPFKKSLIVHSRNGYLSPVAAP